MNGYSTNLMLFESVVITTECVRLPEPKNLTPRVELRRLRPWRQKLSSCRVPDHWCRRSCCPIGYAHFLEPCHHFFFRRHLVLVDAQSFRVPNELGKYLAVKALHRRCGYDALGCPPMPISAWIFVPATAAEMPAERSPSEIRRIRAQRHRTSSTSFLCRVSIETDNRKIVDIAAQTPAIFLRLSSTGASISTAPRHEGPTTILSI